MARLGKKGLRRNSLLTLSVATVSKRATQRMKTSLKNNIASTRKPHIRCELMTATTSIYVTWRLKKKRRKDKTHSCVNFSTPPWAKRVSRSLGMIQRYEALAAAVNGKSMFARLVNFECYFMQSIWNLDARWHKHSLLSRTPAVSGSSRLKM